MKNLLKYFLFFILMLYAAGSEAGATYPGGPADPRDAVAQYGNLAQFPISLEVHNTTYFKLCEIRRFFCGGIKIVMVACAVFIVGLLIIIGKMTWLRLMVVISGIAIFTSAEYITQTLTTLPPNLGVVYSCYCLPGQRLISHVDDWL